MRVSAALSSVDAVVVPFMRWRIVTPLVEEDAALRLANLITSDDDPRDDPQRPLRGTVSFGDVRLRRAIPRPGVIGGSAWHHQWLYVITGKIRAVGGGSELDLRVFPGPGAALILFGTLALTLTSAYSYLAAGLLPFGVPLAFLVMHALVQAALRVQIARTRRAIAHAFGAN